MTTQIGNPIKQMDFARLTSNKKLKDYGFKAGDEFMVLGLKQAPASKSDLYLTRTYAVVVPIVDGVARIPDQGNEYKAYTVDPRNFEKIEGGRVKELEECIREQYAR